MNCKRAKLHIALLIGDDLEDGAQAELRDHLRECHPCREYHKGMAAAPHPLQGFEARPDFQQHDSLWPDLLGKLPPRPGERMHDFNGWWAALSVAVACLAIGLFWNDEARSGRWSSPVAAQNVSPDSDSFATIQGEVPRVVGTVSVESSLRPQISNFDSGRRQLFLPIGPDSRPQWLLAPLLRGAGTSETGGMDWPSNPPDDVRP